MSEHKFVVNKFGDRYIYDVNQDLFEQDCVDDVLVREIGDDLNSENSLYLIVGSDSGNLLKYVNNREIPRGSRYIFVEPDDVFESLLAEGFTSDLSENIHLIEYKQLEQTLIDCKFKDYIYISGVKRFRSLAAQYGFLQTYRTLYWEVDTLLFHLRKKVSAGVYAHEIYTKQQLVDCSDNVVSINSLKECFVGRTAIVLGAGPSLDDHLDWVKENRSKLVVFAVSRLSTRLLEVGIEPDVVVSLDPNDSFYGVSKDMLKFSDKVIFVHQNYVTPRLLAQWPHRKFYIGPLLPWKSDLNIDSPLWGTGPTVSNGAAAVAAWAGCTTVLLAGVDMCFTPEGLSHAEGTAERKSGPRLNLPKLTVETYDGQQALTISEFRDATFALRDLAAACKTVGIRFFNLSPSAAKIGDIQQIAPSSAMHLLHQNVFSDVKLTSTAPSLDWLTSLRSELTAKRDELNSMMQLAEHAINIHSSMYIDDQVVPEMKRGLESIDQQLADEFPDMLALSKQMALRELLSMNHSLYDLESMSSLDIRERLEKYYCAIKQGIDRTESAISRGLEKVECRISEINDLYDPEDFAKNVVPTWNRLKEYGRSVFDCFSYLPDSIIKPVKDAFKDDLEFDYAIARAQDKKRESMQALPVRIQQLKDADDLNGLIALRISLADDIEYDLYLALLDGHISAMKGDLESALLKLAPIVDQPPSPVLEPALALIAGVSSQLDNAQVTLDALAGLAFINKKYLRLYADALAANEQYQDAIDHLLHYLKHYPADNVVRAKLMAWFQKLDVPQGQAAELIAKL